MSSGSTSGVWGRCLVAAALAWGAGIAPGVAAKPTTEVATACRTAASAPPEEVSMAVRIETSRPQPSVGSGLGITAEFKNTSKKDVLFLSSDTTTLTFPPEMEGPLEQMYGRQGYFSTEYDQYRIEKDKPAWKGKKEDPPMVIAIQPGRSYRAVWVLDKKADEIGQGADQQTKVAPAWWQWRTRLSQSRLWQQVSAEARYLFFVPGDYRVMVQAKVGVNAPPQLENHRYLTLSETATVKMAAPQTVILLGAMLGGLVSVFLFPQSRPKSVILSYREGGFVPSLMAFFGLVYSVAGACLLSAIVTVMLARLSETQFLVKISVNDFWGAVVVGFIAQYAGVAVLDKLVPGRIAARQAEAGGARGEPGKPGGAPVTSTRLLEDRETG